jgi:hypothetical protein
MSIHPVMTTTEHSIGVEMLARQECMRLLASHPVGRVAVVVDGWRMTFPVSHRVVHYDDIVFHSEDVSKVAGTSSGVRMSLEIDDLDESGELGWSVAVHGVGREVDPSEMARLRKLGLEPGGLAASAHWIRIRPEKITGYRFPSAPEARRGVPALTASR